MNQSCLFKGNEAEKPITNTNNINGIKPNYP